MSRQAVVRLVVQALYFFAIISVQTVHAVDAHDDEVAVISRGFQHPDYRSTYAGAQLFSISDAGRITLPIKRSISNLLSRPAEFEPEFELTGSPMIKIRASGVTVDLNGFYVRKLFRGKPGEFLPFAVAFEVGYSPAELAADPTLTQVENVVIKNGGLIDFEMGIVVHAGVKNVILEDLYIAGSPLGILFLGQPNSQIAACSVKNVRVTGNFRDDSLVLQWAKVKIEQNNIASIDSANGGTGIVKGKPGSPAAGFGYGTSYPCMQLQHNPVTNMNDAYPYHGIYMNNAVNMICKDILIKCTGYQSDRHGMVQPGQTVGSVTNPATSSVSIIGDPVVGVGTSTITKGMTIENCATVLMDGVESVQLVSALATYGIFAQSSNHITLQRSVSAELDTHHITTASSPQAVIDANVAIDTSLPHPTTGATILSLYATLNTHIAGLPASNFPALDATIASCRDQIVLHNNAIAAGIGLPALLYHVEQIIASAQCIIQAYNALILSMSSLTVDDSTAFLQASSIVQTATDLFNQAYQSIYVAGRVCFGLYLNTVNVFELSDAHMHRNKSQHFTAGLFVQNVDNVSLSDLDTSYNIADDQGSSTATPIPVAPHASSYGAALVNVDNIKAKSLIANSNSSTGQVTGLFGYSLNNWLCDGCITSSNIATLASLPVGWSLGTSIFGQTSFQFSKLTADGNHGKRRCCGVHISPGSSGEFSRTNTNNNISDTDDVIGMWLQDCQSVEMRDVQATANSGSVKSYGFKMDSCSAVDICDMIADDNFVDATNISATDAFGIWLFQPSSFTLSNVSGSYNRGRSLGIGLWAKQAKSFHINDSSFCVNSAVAYAVGEQERCNDAPDASKFLPKDYLSGALGMYLRESKDIIMSNVTACKNFAHRAAGIFALNCYDVMVEDSNTSFQSATGDYFISNPFTGLSFCHLPIPGSQYATIFGSPQVVDPMSPPNVIPANELNLLKAVCVFMNSMATIATDDGLKNFLLSDILTCVDIYSRQKSISLAWLLIQAAMAKYRLFGTAVGLHVHDGDGFSVKNHFANGNQSKKDNAVGIGCTGRCGNHLFDENRAINNDGWTDSELGAIAPEKYDLAAVKPFYQALYATSGDTLSNDFDFGIDGTHLYPKAANFEVYNGHLFKRFPYFQITLNCVCPPTSAVPTPTWFTSPVGGIGVGVLLADCCEQIEVRNMDCSNNKGYSGASFGILLDVCSNATIEHCRLYQNYANLLGWCYGVADITTISSSLMMRNFLFGNRLEQYLNSNYFVPYDPLDPYALTFPVRSGFNGDFTTLTDLGVYDNVEIRFARSAPQHCSLPDDVAHRIDSATPSCWEVFEFVDNSGSVVVSPLEQCHTDITTLAPATAYFIDYFTNIIIETVLAYPAGAQAIEAGAQAGVNAGLLEILSLALATVVDSNRYLCTQDLQTLICQQLYTQLFNDPLLLIAQESLSLLKPKQRGHLVGVNYLESQQAAYAAALASGLDTTYAAGLAVVIQTMLEQSLGRGGNSAVLAARDMHALKHILEYVPEQLSVENLLAARALLREHGFTSDRDLHIQQSIERFVALRLLRGQSTEQIMQQLMHNVHPYADVIEELQAALEGMSRDGVVAGMHVIESFLGLACDNTLLGSSAKIISEHALFEAAVTAAQRVDSGVSIHQAILLSAFDVIVYQATLVRCKELSHAQIRAKIAPVLAIVHDQLQEQLHEYVHEHIDAGSMKPIFAQPSVQDLMKLVQPLQASWSPDASQMFGLSLSCNYKDVTGMQSKYFEDATDVMFVAAAIVASSAMLGEHKAGTVACDHALQAVQEMVNIFASGSCMAT